MRIVLIGGGDVGTTDNSPYNLKEIDETIVKLTGKAHPRILFFGFTERANFTFGAMKKNFMALGAQCEYLSYRDFLNTKTIESKFKRTDAIYIGGGNTLTFMRDIKKYQLDIYLKDALERNVILCGRSAGAICFSKFGSSDARKFKDNENKFVKVKGLGFINALFCPHFNSKERRNDLKRMLNSVKEVAISATNCAAIVIQNEDYYIVKSSKDAKVFKCYYKNQKYFETELNKNGKLVELLQKM